MKRVRKWLGSSITLSLRWGELLAIVALATVITLLWPGVPTWVFFLIGFAVGFSQWAARDLRRWLQRRRAA